MTMDEEPLQRDPRFGWQAKLLAVLAAGGLLINLFSLRGPTQPNPTPSQTASPSSLPSVSPSGSPSGVDPIAAMPPAIARVAIEVERIRGLRFLEPVDVQIVSNARLDARLSELVASELDPKEIRRADRTWTTLGLLQPDQDLLAAIRSLNQGGVAGFYDEETGELLVGTQTPNQLSPATRYYVAHELTHALTDQHHDLSPLRTLEETQDASDAAFAYRALVEGDAVIVAERYRASFTFQEQQEYQQEQNSRDRSALADVPAPLLQSFGFPYSAGTAFVNHLLSAGSFRAVDKAYRQRPKGTREIIHPGEYPAKEVSLPDFIDIEKIWKQVEAEALGEFDLRLILDRDPFGDVTDAQAAAAAAGWRAGRYRTMAFDKQTVVEAAVKFSSQDQAQQAADTFRLYLQDFADGGSETYGEWSGWSGPDASGAWLVQGGRLRFLVASSESALRLYLQS
jgi:hypothetical protein